MAVKIELIEPEAPAYARPLIVMLKAIIADLERVVVMLETDKPEAARMELGRIGQIAGAVGRRLFDAPRGGK